MSSVVRRSAVTLLTVVGVLVLWPSAPADAARDAGASSRVVGRGDIVTSILGPARPRPRPSERRVPMLPPRCTWATLDDASIEWLVAVLAARSGWNLDLPLLDPLAPYLEDDELPDGDLEVQTCDGEPVDLRFVPSPEPLITSEVLLRRMITRLPAPEPVTSPPAGAVVPVGHPVFLSLPVEQWQPVRSELSHDGITAEVEAVPLSMRVVSGDPTATVHTCLGPGRAFDPASSLPPTRQADTPGACVVRYARANGLRPDGTRRPPTWIGSITVIWSARWRTDDGEWRSLGSIPRTRLFQREAGELSTVIETTRR